MATKLVRANPFMNALRKLNDNLEKRPMTTNVLMGCGLGALGDVLAQFGLERKTLNTFDKTRFCAMTTFSGFYPGIISLRLFNIYPKLLPNKLKNYRIVQGLWGSLLDVCVHSPLLYLPSFYIWSGFTQGKSPDESLGHYKDQFLSIMETLAGVWIPVQALNFSVVPPRLRVVFVGMVNIGWNTYIDYKNHH